MKTEVKDFIPGYDVRFFTEPHEGRDYLYWVITSEGETVGHGYLELSVHHDGSSELYSRDAVINRQFRGRGIYRQLLQFLRHNYSLNSDNWDMMTDDSRKAWKSFPDVKKVGRYPYEYRLPQHP